MSGQKKKKNGFGFFKNKKKKNRLKHPILPDKIIFNMTENSFILN